MARRRRQEEEPQTEEPQTEEPTAAEEPVEDEEATAAEPAEAAVAEGPAEDEEATAPEPVEADLHDQVDMTYLGTSGRFIDRITGLTWQVGQIHRIGSEDAQRIIDAVPQDSWEKVKAVGDPPPAPPEPEVAPPVEETSGF